MNSIEGKKGTEEASELKKNISDNLFDQLLNPTIDLSIDYTEIFIDDIIENEAVKEIPIIKSIVGLIKGGISINQFWFAKKILTFIREFNQKNIPPDKLRNFRIKLDKNVNFKKNVAERLMIFIEKNVDITQTIIISNLFSAFVNEKINFEELNNIIITLDKLHPKTFSSLFEMEKFNFQITEENSDEIGERNFEIEALLMSSGFAMEHSVWFSGFELTDDGKMLYEHGIKPIKKIPPTKCEFYRSCGGAQM